MKTLKKHAPFLIVLLLSLIPTMIPLIHQGYFSMHDDQHIARLYLLIQGFKQGSIYPRWVDQLGFGFGYPLFNFYPPLIYYVSALFALIGLSLITSIKLMIATGITLGALGVYGLMNSFSEGNRKAALLTGILFSYFQYRAVTIYVRGSFAEFFALSLLPFVFWFFHRLSKKPTVSNAIVCGVSIALVILAHPFIAFPMMGYVGLYFIWNLFTNVGDYQGETTNDSRPIPERKYFSAPGSNLLRRLLIVLDWIIGRYQIIKKNYSYIISSTISVAIGLGLSAFFWLPSMLERKYTMVNDLLLTELAAYKLHFIELFQFWYSPWGYGGSVAGTADGMSFQLGKPYILFVLAACMLCSVTVFLNKKFDKQFILHLFLLGLSLFMTTSFSLFLWDHIAQLQYLQFPWRFLSFVAIFIAIVGGYIVVFLEQMMTGYKAGASPGGWGKQIPHAIGVIILVMIICVFVGYKNQHYFQPQTYIQTTDSKRTSYEELAWRISKTSYEFSPKGVATKKNEYGASTFDIEKDQLSKSPYRIATGGASVDIVSNSYHRKEFQILSDMPSKIEFSTFHFPGWHAYIDGREVQISDANKYKLISLSVPKGKHTVLLEFNNTLARKIANSISFITVFLIGLYYFRGVLFSSKR